MATLDADIYDILESVDELKSQYIDETEETLGVDIYGYLGAIESRKIQSSIVVASELSNELFAQRAKYDQNLITHAINCNIEGINAVPSSMTILLGLLSSDITDNLNNDGSFVIDRESAIFINSTEFHPVYDIILKRSEVNGISIFSAQYNITHADPNADIENPYLASPYTMSINGEEYIFIKCELKQLFFSSEVKSILSNNLIENKTFNFDFENQLSYFEVFVGDNLDTADYITPVFEGASIPTGTGLYCYYTYLDSNTIRVKFTRNSYTPLLNDEITIKIYTTLGEEGSFKYTADVYGSLESERFNYNNIDYIIKPYTDSEHGADRKSKAELQRLLPKESFARGIISTSTDLDNYFNQINNSSNIIKTQKKVDNQTERTFYTYMVMKDSDNNIVPTNTLPLYVSLENLKVQELQEDTRLLLPAGTVFGYNSTTGNAYVYDTEDSSNNAVITSDNLDDVEEVVDDESYNIYNSDYGNLNDPNNFIYISPFTIVINRSPLYMEYFLTKIDANPYLDFTFINLNAPITFISNSIHWERKFYTEKNKYTMSIDIAQNVNVDLGLVTLEDLITEALEDENQNDKEDNTLDILTNKLTELSYTPEDGKKVNYETCYGNYYITSENINVTANNSMDNIVNEYFGTTISEAITNNSTLDSGVYSVYTKINDQLANIGSISITTDGNHSFAHNPVMAHFMNTIFGSYFVSKKDFNTFEAKDTTIDWSSSLQSAKSGKESGLLNVYVLCDNVIRKLGVINLYSGTTTEIYDWSSYNYIFEKVNIENRYNNYYVSENNYSVFYSDVVKASSTLEAAVRVNAHEVGTSTSGNFYAYTFDKNNNPIKLGELYIEYSTDSDNNYAKYSFVSTEEIEDIRYDDYFTSYKLYPYKLKDTNITDDGYSGSLVDYIKNNINSLVNGIYYVYTIGPSNTPVPIGSIDLSIYLDSDVVGAYYTWTKTEDYIVHNDMKVIAVFYRDGSPYRYEDLQLNLENSDLESPTYNFETSLTTDDTLDLDNNMRIDDSYVIRTNSRGYGYFNGVTECTIYVFAKIKDDDDGDYTVYPYTGNKVLTYSGLNPLEVFPGIDLTGYSLCNIYSVNEGIEFYTNYGNIINSVVTPIESISSAGVTSGYKLSSVPLIGYRYSIDEDHITEVVYAMNIRKAYMDNCLKVLENTIGIDFKFFNTFGPSKQFTIDGTNYIDRVNLSLLFALKLGSSNDSNIRNYIAEDVKEYIEDLDELDSIHLSKLITQINTDYAESIVYFDFLGFNDYDLNVLHLYKDETDDVEINTPPEFISVNNVWNETTQDFEPDITIKVIE